MRQRRVATALLVVPAMLAGLLVTSGGGAAGAAPPRTAVAAATVGQPPRDYVIPAGSIFAYPNRSRLERVAIRNRVLYTIQSVWGGRRDPATGVPLASNGTIRIATWSFDDWTIARALVAARNRGVSVQLMAAAGANVDSAPWQYLRRSLGANLYRPGHPRTAEQYTFARQCRGACRGAGGTPHSKYFMFDNVGSRHARNVVVQTSMNLTGFAVKGQWNQAQVLKSRSVYDDYLRIFHQTKLGRRVASPYHVASFGNVVDLFFPRPGGTAASDPVMQILNHVSCRGSAVTGDGRTRIRVVQYAIYGNRGAWIAKKLRYLWNAGCDVGIIYSITSRPVLSILRSSYGRGKVPMRQSVIRNNRDEIVKYNHSKWMTIAGRWGGNSRSWLTFNGSSNWSDTFGNDEQMQRISGIPYVLAHNAAYVTTWRQRTSHLPPGGRLVATGRTLFSSVPEEPVFGQGELRYLDPNG